MQRMMGQKGLLKIYSLFNNSKASDVRKLAGRLLCEALHKSPKNQDFFCELFDLDCTYGRVSINQNLPALIKQKLASEPDFLFSLHSMGKLTAESQGGNQFHQTRSNSTQSNPISTPPAKRYWSFPEFKEISTAVLKSQRHNNNIEPDSNSPQMRQLMNSQYQTTTGAMVGDFDKLS